MAEYYPLLSKAVGSLPNSTPDTRRIVYERARKALIGQLRTMHPPIPDEDIERESVALDRAIERVEAELATNGGGATAVATPPAPTKAAPPKPETQKPGVPKPVATASPAKAAPSADTKPADTRPADAKPADATIAAPADETSKPKPANEGGAIGPGELRPTPPIRPRTPLAPSPFAKKADAKPVSRAPGPETAIAVTPSPAVPTVQADATPDISPPAPIPPKPPGPPTDKLKPPRADARPIAPLPPGSERPKRRLWIIPAAVGLVVLIVGFAAWKLRDHPDQIARTKPAETTQPDSGKIAERVGGAPADDKSAEAPAPQQDATAPPAAPTPDQAPQKQTQQAAAPPAANNPELPVAHRAALLVEAPDEPNKVKTFLGTVVWKLNNVPQGPNDAVGLAVEADIDLPEDKMKAVVTFEKNTDASLAASHTIKVRFTIDQGSFSGDVKQISTPQMRPESSPSGDALAGVTVPIVANSFLVGLSPGNAETANTDLIKRLQWIDIPMLLNSGKIAKLTFEKSDSGQRDLNEAFNSWAK